MLNCLETCLNRDNKFVERVFKELIVGTDAEYWAKGKRGAREIMIAVRDHYMTP